MSLSESLHNFMHIYAFIVMQLIAWGMSLPIVPSVANTGDSFGIANPDSSFDDCHGSPMPDDKGNGCTHGGLPNGR